MRSGRPDGKDLNDEMKRLRIHWADPREATEEPRRPVMVAVWQVDGDGWSRVEDEPEPLVDEDEARGRAS